MNMDKPLRRVAIFALLLFFGLMAQVNYVQGSQAEDLRNADNNARRFADIFEHPRGEITADGKVLVKSIEDGDDKYGRQYKDGLIYSPVTGVWRGTSATKVELAYSSLLSGDDTRIASERWFDTFIGKEREGADLELTLDTKAQQLAYQQLKANTTRRAGAAVVDVETGAVKVLASYPSYDPNQIAPQADNAAKRLNELNKGNGSIKPLIDNAMSQTFPPGSSFKTVVAAIAMEKDGLDKNSTVDTGKLILPGSNKPLPNSHDTGNCAGSAPLIGAFAESCNTTFAKMAMAMGIEELAKASEKWGFNKPLPVEPDVSAAASSVPVEITDPQTGEKIKTGPDGTARSGIGQENVRATPLQMALVAAAVANGGKMMKPYLVEKARAQDQTELFSADPEVLSQATTEDIADDLEDMMRAVVTTGTATQLAQFGIAGKTGTAEQGSGNPNARWFIGFSPINDPKYAFAVMTEGAGAGATGAGPAAGRIMQEVRRK